MPPKRKDDSASGQKRKRETKAEKLAKVKAEWEKKKQAVNNDDSDEETPAKKAKVSSPKKEKPASRRKNVASSSAPTRSSSRRKDPPAVAKTPPRSTATSKKQQPDRLFFSPNPTGSGSKAPPKEDDDEEDEAIPLPLPLPDLPMEKSAEKGDNPGLRPKKEENPMPEEEGRAAAAKGGEEVEEDDNDDDDDDDDDYHTDSSFDEDDEENHELQMQLDQLQRQDDQRLDVPVPRKKSMFWVMVETAVTCFLAFSAVSYVFPSVRDLLPTLWEPGPGPTVCFYDSPHTQHEHPVKTVSACRDGEETPVVWEDCPSDAYCRGGSLLKCPDGFSVTPQGCTLTEDSSDALDSTIGLLQAWTAQDICKGHPERHEEDGFGGSPLFHYSRVTGELEMGYNLGLVKHANNSRFLLKSSPEGDLWIGLHPRVHVPLSYLCHFKRLVYWVLGISGYLLYLSLYIVVGGLLKLLFDSLLEEPLLVGGGMICVVVVGSLVLRKHRETKARLLVENDIVQCRELAWKILSDNPSKSFKTNELVEKVQWTRYPMSRSGRKRVAKIVMPQLAEDFRSDSRIKNVRQLDKGKPVDAWQWTADMPAGLSGQ